MSMHQIPTLVIGIGGIGCQIAASLSDRLTVEDRKYVSVIGMDTNVQDLRALQAQNIRVIRTSDDRRVFEYTGERFHPEYARWVPENSFLRQRDMVTGAGQVRVLSRLAGLAAEERGDFGAIHQEIQRITARDGNTIRSSLTVMIVGSITGGTGAGLFTQLPYYIRRQVSQDTGIDQIVIRGMFVGPDLTADVQPTDTNKDSVRVNGYSCLKELNALYMRQSIPTVGDRLQLEYFDENRSAIPYDYLYLVESSTQDGSIGNAPIPTVVRQVSDMVFTLMFTPVIGRAQSTEDNFVLSQIQQGGMNRYASAGLCRLVFPQEEAERYVALRAVKELVQGEWLLLDDEVEEARKNASDQRSHDPNVEIPEVSSEYITCFADETRDGGGLAVLRFEGYYTTETGELESKGQLFVDAVEEEIGEVVELPEFKQAKEACALNQTQARSFSTAEDAFKDADKAVEQLIAVTKELESKYRSRIADKMFPVTLSILERGKKNEHSVYQWLAGVHPVTARFLCYDIAARLREKIEEMEEQIKGFNLSLYQDTDFHSEEGKQNPTQALDQIQNPTKSKSVISRKLLGGDKKDLGKLVNQVRDIMSSQVQAAENHLRTQLTLDACKLLLERFKSLADNYAMFFQTIGKSVEETGKDITNLENSYLNNPLGESGVYCSVDAFRKMFSDYDMVRQRDLPEATKEAVFLSLFQVLCNEQSTRGAYRTEEMQRRAEAQKADQLGRIFRDAIVETIQTDVVSKGTGIVRMNIRQALEKELELRDNVTRNNTPAAEYQQRINEYTRERIKSAFSMAGPMLAATRTDPNNAAALVYLALNPECAETIHGVADAGETQQLMVPQPNEATDNQNVTVLLDEEFKKTEIICFRAAYLYLIEDLVKYRPGSENEKAYRTRIHNVRYADPASMTSATFESYLPPHLNKDWHEEAFLPALTPDERKQAQKELRMAFIYGLGLGYFKKQADDDRDDDTPVWHYRGQPIRNCGVTIGGSYVDLYESLTFNGRMKEDILRRAEAAKAEKKGYKDVEDLLEELPDHALMRNLFGGKHAAAGVKQPNVLEILLKMREGMPKGDWEDLFNGLREVLWDYLGFLFDERPRYVNGRTREIIRKLCVTSEVGFATDENGDLLVDPDEGPILSDDAARGATRMVTPIKRLLDREYKKD